MAIDPPWFGSDRPFIAIEEKDGSGTVVGMPRGNSKISAAMPLNKDARKFPSTVCRCDDFTMAKYIANLLNDENAVLREEASEAQTTR